MATVERAVPPLIEGMKMDRDEFLRLWELHPEIKFAELIGGEVYIPPRRTVEHGSMAANVIGWAGYFKAFTPGVCCGANCTTLLSNDVAQPKMHLRILPEHGGLTWVEGELLAGPPELIAEICETWHAPDLHEKLNVYEAAAIQEYSVVLLTERRILWHQLVDGVYQIMPPDPDGIWRSRVFPRLWLDGQALVAGDAAKVLAKLQEGLASAEHQEFVQLLQARKDAKKP